MIDRELAARLDGARVSFCLIGARALAVHGVPLRDGDRMVELLTVDTDVLRPLFWPDGLRPEVHLGDAGDHHVGLLRWSGTPAHQLRVGRGHAMVFAVNTAHPNDDLGCRVATPLGLLLLALQTRGIDARADIEALVRAQAARLGVPWRPAVEEHLASMAPSAAAAWHQIARYL